MSLPFPLRPVFNRLRFAAAGPHRQQRGMVRGSIIAATCLFLAACGFHPLYGDSRLEPRLASIFVEPVPQRDGYELRNTLIDLLGADGRAAGKAYHLHLTLNENSQGIALQNDATVTRYNDQLTVNYVLTDAKGAEIVHGSQSSLSSFNVAASPYATLAEQQDSDKRAAQDIAERIRTDLGVYFSRGR